MLSEDNIVVGNLLENVSFDQYFHGNLILITNIDLNNDSCNFKQYYKNENIVKCHDNCNLSSLKMWAKDNKYWIIKDRNMTDFFTKKVFNSFNIRAKYTL